MAQDVSPHAQVELGAIETDLKATATARVVNDFRVCASNLSASLDRICSYPPPGYPRNVTVTGRPFFPTHHRREEHSRFVTYNRMEAEFLDVRDPRTGGRVVLVVGYHYER